MHHFYCGNILFTYRKKQFKLSEYNAVKLAGKQLVTISLLWYFHGFFWGGGTNTERALTPSHQEFLRLRWVACEIHAITLIEMKADSVHKNISKISNKSISII